MAGHRLIRLGYRILGLLLFLSTPLLAGEEAPVIPVNPAMITPFVLLLLSIAVVPFISKHWWEKYYPVVAIGLGFISCYYYLFQINNPARLLGTGIEYISFITLIGSLFVVSGGIHIRIRGKSTPTKNVILLGVGAVLANFLGTTGASMILIRPFLRVNRYRIRKFHVVYFIFIVSNMGGALTPIGDPPLFLGYLKGVPFFWVFTHVWHIWLIATAIGLSIFWFLDYRSFKQYEEKTGETDESLYDEDAEVHGLQNLFFLAVILVAVFIQKPLFLREAIMMIAAAGSYFTTKKGIHHKNDFTFHPIKEVAILFVGIFATMIPALDWLELNAANIGITSAGQFYWGSGVLSSVLDNAPTYLNFLSAAVGLFVSPDLVHQVQQLVGTHGANILSVAGNYPEDIRNTLTFLVQHHGELVAVNAVPDSDIQIAYLVGNHALYLMAISIGSVFFGAFTYIGNGPNFMVKSIAEHAHVRCPSFFGYIVQYSFPILLPIFALVWFLFFR